FKDSDSDLKVGDFPESWRLGLGPTVASVWAALASLEDWQALQSTPVLPLGRAEYSGNPYPSAHLLALSLLGRQPDGAFVSATALERWIVARHPYWSTRTLAMNGDPKTSTRRAGKTSAGAGIEQPERGIARFLLAVAYPLRLVQATHDANGEW